MSVISIVASDEATAGIMPSWIFIKTNNTLADVMALGYLNGQSLTPFGVIGVTPSFASGQAALVTTSNKGTVSLVVDIDGSNNISLIAPESA